MTYFDYNATSPVAPEVAEAFAAANRELWGNPSSLHRAGQQAREALETARRRIAEFLHASPAEIALTSGGTESNNLAILGLARQLPAKSASAQRHIVTSAIEHPAVLGPIEQLRREGFRVTHISPNADGLIDADDVLRSIQPETVLISLMHANNEVGTLQPIADVAAYARQHGIFVHSDGVQAAGRIPVDVHALGVHLYSLSSHKLSAPKGTGVLFVAKGTPLQAVQWGGRHERERRAGTENVAGAVALARALVLPFFDATVLRDSFETKLQHELPQARINGDHAPRLPNTSNVTFPGLSGEALTIALDMQGMAVSTGSACSSGSIDPSPVLLAMGRTRDEARATLRFSFGRENTMDDVEQLVQALAAITGRMSKTQSKTGRPEVAHA